MSNIQNPIELEDIISRIAMLFSTNADRNIIAEMSRQHRDMISINRTTRAGAMMQGAMARYRLTKFPPITSMDQKIREVVPPFWILATAMSNHATARERRGHASEHVGERYLTQSNSLTPNNFVPNHVPDPQMDTPHFRRLESEGYFHVQYHFHPDRTLRQFFQSITDKVHGVPIDVARFFNPAVQQTAPELLVLTFTGDELGNFGW